MYPPNEERVLALLREDDVVLDIGGWARPFNRADYVLDQGPYATRGWYGLPAQGGAVERFDEKRWIQRDICAHEPFPFGDKTVDFVVCSHTLEDIRDPLWVCSEMNRIGKAGYLETPSRVAESCRGVEPGQVGWTHHRWLVEMADGGVQFMMKYHKIHSHWSLSLPRRYLRGLSADRQVTWLFWTDAFSFQEVAIHGAGDIRAELARFVASVHPYPPWLVAGDGAVRRGAWLAGRAWDRLRGRG